MNKNKYILEHMNKAQVEAWKTYVQNRVAYAEATQNKVLTAVWKAALAQIGG